MNDYKVPTPEQVGYYEKAEAKVQDAINEIKYHLNKQIFEFKPSAVSKEVPISTLQDILLKYGWNIKTDWKGATKDDGYTVWILEPLSKYV